MIDRRLVTFLQEQQVRYCLIGAAGLAVRGWARYSADIDLLTMDARVLEKNFWLTEHDITITRGDSDDPLGGVIRWTATPPHDIIVGRGKAMSYAVETAETNATIQCPVATSQALVLLKLEAGGTQDCYDILGLAAASKALNEIAWLSHMDEYLQLLRPRARRLWKKLKAEIETAGT